MGVLSPLDVSPKSVNPQSRGGGSYSKVSTPSGGSLGPLANIINSTVSNIKNAFKQRNDANLQLSASEYQNLKQKELTKIQRDPTLLKGMSVTEYFEGKDGFQGWNTRTKHSLMEKYGFKAGTILGAKFTSNSLNADNSLMNQKELIGNMASKFQLEQETVKNFSSIILASNSDQTAEGMHNSGARNWGIVFGEDSLTKDINAVREVIDKKITLYNVGKLKEGEMPAKYKGHSFFLKGSGVHKEYDKESVEIYLKRKREIERKIDEDYNNINISSTKFKVKYNISREHWEHYQNRYNKFNSNILLTFKMGHTKGFISNGPISVMHSVGEIQKMSMEAYNNSIDKKGFYENALAEKAWEVSIDNKINAYKARVENYFINDEFGQRVDIKTRIAILNDIEKQRAEAKTRALNQFKSLHAVNKASSQKTMEHVLEGQYINKLGKTNDEINFEIANNYNKMNEEGGESSIVEVDKRIPITGDEAGEQFVENSKVSALNHTNNIRNMGEIRVRNGKVSFDGKVQALMRYGVTRQELNHILNKKDYVSQGKIEEYLKDKQAGQNTDLVQTVDSAFIVYKDKGGQMRAVPRSFGAALQMYDGNRSHAVRLKQSQEYGNYVTPDIKQANFEAMISRAASRPDVLMNLPVLAQQALANGEIDQALYNKAMEHYDKFNDNKLSKTMDDLYKERSRKLYNSIMGQIPQGFVAPLMNFGLNTNPKMADMIYDIDTYIKTYAQYLDKNREALVKEGSSPEMKLNEMFNSFAREIGRKKIVVRVPDSKGNITYKTFNWGNFVKGGGSSSVGRPAVNPISIPQPSNTNIGGNSFFN